MKCTIPEISWHNKDPVLSVDIQPKNSDGFLRLASGGTDSHILIWRLTEKDSGVPSLECVSDLTRHQKAVNVVRFSPSGNFLASGDDESVVIIWKLKTDQDPIEFPGEDEIKYQEQWLVFKILRGHLEDIYDLSWSADEQQLISGSVDNTAIIWDIKKGRMKGILRDHKSFVQGVAWDPAGQLLATLSSDRICRIFNASTQKVISRASKATLPGSKPESKPVHLFHDDTMKSFFRRLCFTPCGSLLIAPAGIVEPQEPGQKPINTTLVFTRNSLSRPVAYLPSYNQYSVAVRCCPKLFALRESADPPLFNLPYRVVFAIATQCSVILYDTQHYSPFAFIANIHYTRLTDLTWSNDGKILIVSSTDGYCSLITFSENELGETYVPSKEVETDTNKEFVNPCDILKKKNTPLKKNKAKNSKISKDDSINNADVKDSIQGSGSKKESKTVDSDPDEDYCLLLEETVTNDVLVSKKDGEKGCDKDSNSRSNIRVSCFSEVVVSSGDKDTTESKKDNVETKNETDNSKITDEFNTDNSKEQNIVISTVEKMDVVEIIPNEISHKTPSKVISSPSFNSAVISSVGSCKTTPPPNITPIEQRKPKRAQLITLSSPKSKKKL